MIIISTQAAKEFWARRDSPSLLLEDENFFLFEVEWDRVRIGQMEGCFGMKSGGEWLDKEFWVNGKLEDTFAFGSFSWPHY